jgi:hypothetical protein
LQGGTATGVLTKYIKIYIKKSFFDIMSEVQKDSEDVSAGLGIYFFISDTKELCQEFDIEVGEVSFDLAPYN